MTTATKPQIRVRLEHDQDTPSPMDDDCQWRLVSFSRRNGNGNPDDYLTVKRDEDTRQITVEPNDELKEKFEAGLGYLLDYFEHGPGTGRWSTHGTGPQCRWDNAQYAGVLLWEHPEDHIGGKTYDERLKDAQGFLESYNDWCNGNCYYYSIEKINYCGSCGQEHDSEDIDSCGGFIGSDHFAEEVSARLQDALEDYPDAEITFRGDAEYIGDYIKTEKDTS